MQVRLDPDGQLLTLAFSDFEGARSYLQEARSNEGLLVSFGSKLPQYQVFEVGVELDGRVHEAFRAYVVRVTESEGGAFAIAMVLQDWDREREGELLCRLEKGGEEPETVQAEKAASQDAEDAGVSEMRGVAAVHKIREMNMGQKAILAQKAGRPERQVLLRDTAPQVLQGLMANPRIEAKEILQIAKSTYATGVILQRIAGDSRWGKNQEVVAAIVRNPKSPSLMVSRMVDKLRTSDLRQMAKMSSGLRETLRKAALREYMKRTGK